MDKIYYEVFIGGECKALCQNWDAKQAALRLLCGTALMLPTNVSVSETKRVPDEQG